MKNWIWGNFIIIFIFSLVWSANLFYEWGTDFGVYYANAMFLDDGYSLYNEIFDHKGPVYYLFLRFIGQLIGWGPVQAYISLLLTAMIYLVPLVFIINKKIVSRNINMVVLFLILASFYGQPTNVSISLFQSGLLIISFYFLISCIKKPDYFWVYWVLSALFYSLSVLTRIDAMIFMPLFFIALIVPRNEKEGLKRYIKFSSALISFSFIFLGLYILLSKYFGFSIEQFIQHNFSFNSWYLKHKYEDLTGYFVRPNQIMLLLFSGILIALVLILRETIRKFCLQSISIFTHIKSVRNFFAILNKIQVRERDLTVLIMSLAILVLGVIGLLSTRSDKQHYIYIFLTPAIFIISYWGWVLKQSQLKYIAALGLYALFLILSPIVFRILKSPDCLTNVFCSASPAHDYEKTVNEVKYLRSFTIIGGRGWPYVFSRSKPDRAVNDWWLYYLDEPFVTSGLKLSHDRLLMRSPGSEFWVDIEIAKIKNKNPYLKELMNRSLFVEDQGRYYKYKIK